MLHPEKSTPIIFSLSALRLTVNVLARANIGQIPVQQHAAGLSQIFHAVHGGDPLVNISEGYPESFGVAHLPPTLKLFTKPARHSRSCLRNPGTGAACSGQLSWLCRKEMNPRTSSVKEPTDSCKAPEKPLCVNASCGFARPIRQSWRQRTAPGSGRSCWSWPKSARPGPSFSTCPPKTRWNLKVIK